MAPALEVRDAAPAMSVQRNYVSRCNVGMNHPYPLVLKQQLMMARRRYERIERVRPRPGMRVVRHWVLVHEVQSEPKYLTLCRGSTESWA